MVHWGEDVVAVLRILHILLAAAWLGSALYATFVVAPVIRQATPQAVRELTGRLMPLGLRWGNAVGGFTVLSGLLLLWVQRDGLDFSDTSGRLLLFGLIGALAVLYLLNFAMGSSWRGLQKILANQDPSMPPPAAATFLQKRLAFASAFNLALLVTVFILMLVAAHSPWAA